MMTASLTYSLNTLAQLVEAQLLGVGGDVTIHGVNSLAAAKPGELSFVQSSRYVPYLKTTKATAVLTKAAWVDEELPLQWLIVPNPRLAFAALAQHFVPERKVEPGIHSTAQIGEDCIIHETATIGPYVVLEKGVEVGPHTVIHSHCVLREGVCIGAHGMIYPHVTIYPACRVGNGVILHSGVVLGADGFGFERSQAGWQRIPQLGAVVLGDDVEIGANSTVDCGALVDTCIGDGVKIDNQVQIGHNAQIGNRVLICGKVAIAGSVTIGDDCVLGGGATIADNLTIVSQVLLAGLTAVAQDIKKPGVYGSSLSALPHMRWKKNMKRFAELDSIAHRLRKLEKQLAKCK